MKCPQCGFENRAGSKFCNECGRPLPASGPLPIITIPRETPSSADITVDLSGIERMADADYVPPVAAWRTGNTAEMPRLSEEQYRRSYHAPVEEDYVPRGGVLRRLLLGLLAVLLIVALGLFATYSMELWGGKTVPDVVGRSHTDAVYMLESKGFQVRATQVKSDDVEGIVLLMDPSPESRLEVGTEVVVHVTVPRIVPDIVGTSKLNAMNLLKEEGFTNVQYVEVKSNEHEGMVLSINLEPETKAKAGTSIVVEVAVPYTVPVVTNMSQADAVELLQKEGYEVAVAYAYSEEMVEGMTLYTDPAAGTELAAGSTVTLYIAKSRGNELIAATRAYLTSQEMFNIGGSTYSVKGESIELTYEGDDTVRYTMKAQRAETHYWDITGEYETKYGETVTMTGLIYWDENNKITGGEPAIYRAG